MNLRPGPTKVAGVSVALGVSYLILTAFSGGITNRTQKNGTGCICHGSLPTAEVSVSILGPEALSAGQTEVYTVAISGGPLSAAGTNIAASAGNLNIVSGQGLRKQGDELTHTGPKVPESGTVSFQFSLTAPVEPGTVTLYANGNSVNLSGDPSGDQWNFALNRTVAITPATSVVEESQPQVFALRQNYPNPFNPSTSIEFILPASAPARLEVFTLAGERVATLVDGPLPAGAHVRAFEGSGLASGVYLYRLTAGDLQSTRRMILTR